MKNRTVKKTFVEWCKSDKVVWVHLSPKDTLKSIEMCNADIGWYGRRCRAIIEDLENPNLDDVAYTYIGVSC